MEILLAPRLQAWTKERILLANINILKVNLFFLHVFLIVHVCVCPFVRPFVIQSVIQSFSQWSCGQSVSLSFSQPVCLSVGPPPSQSDSLSVCQFVSLSVSQSVSQSGREAGGKASRQANRWAVDFSMALIKLARPTILIPSFLCLL